MLSSGVMQTDTFLSAIFLYNDDIFAGCIIVEVFYGFVLYLLALLATEEKHIVFPESICQLFSRHTEVKCLLPFQHTGIFPAKPCNLLLVLCFFRGIIFFLQRLYSHIEYGFEWWSKRVLALHTTMEYHCFPSACKMFFQAGNDLRHLHTLEQCTGVIIITHHFMIGVRCCFIS